MNLSKYIKNKYSKWIYFEWEKLRGYKNLNNIKLNIQRRINTSFLKNVSDEYRTSNISLVFTMGSGYREIYKYYLMLQEN